MPDITYITVDGTARVIDVPVGTSVMRGAVLNDVPGIVAQCGGNAQCATCHVYVDEATRDKPEPVRPDEDDMLGFTACPRTEGSRLSCRLKVTEALDGLVVRLPERQY
ncbi:MULTISPECIES: 2Fe-2S iron-sulfur cluster-binding protein [Streptomyces]|uniref:Ferredoxin n=2 Tax=Streptomyces TaxID=1883 RepID=A0A0W7X1S6_9ACTN|nr:MULTISPECIES: 2Fe-2S iron-sulfur cluster-binding protein [Streptomyces]KUF16698.1 ferredoxin [Streptomyces silvensis]MVO90727.1 2Fe-2S iron-sulfur cluster binding domain-containing protein [Streptomyces typhae]